MPRMIDLVRKSQMSANMMQAAARGALMVQPGEMIEILVHLAQHNKVFGEQARMTLAGWDEKASIGVASDPATSKEVLTYLISAKNLRPSLLPALLGNPSITDEELAELAVSASRAIVEGMLLSPRMKTTPVLVDALRSNPRLRANELAELGKPAAAQDSPVETSPVEETLPAVEADPHPEAPGIVSTEEVNPEKIAAEIAEEGVLVAAISHYLETYAAELNAEGEKPFQAVRLPHEGTETDDLATAAGEPSGPEEETAPTAVSPGGSQDKPGTAARPAVPGAKLGKKPPSGEQRRDSTLQKIARLDIKGRIALAMRGSKEERSILIRDGTKLVALAVLDSPKISDGEVEKFALQKNVLEAVLRAIPLKRRFAKNYTITRNLVYNPRTPLDLSLGLMKNLLVHDLKNLSENKEVSDTIRKLALRMFKQKREKKNE